GNTTQSSPLCVFTSTCYCHRFQLDAATRRVTVVQLLKAGKGKEVSYNALATHIISEDGDNPEVSESREVFDLPVVKVNRFFLPAMHFSLLNLVSFSCNRIAVYRCTP
ncbi:PAX-interacting protein 1, partial [Goodea atripinnis]